MVTWVVHSRMLRRPSDPRPKPTAGPQILSAAINGDARVLLRSRNRDLMKVLKHEFGVVSPREQACGAGQAGSTWKRVLSELLLNHGHLRRCKAQPARAIEAAPSSRGAQASAGPACHGEFNPARLPYKWLPGLDYRAGAAEYAEARLGGLGGTRANPRGPRRRIEVSHVMEYADLRHRARPVLG